jgi:hypothetical protein
MNRKRRRDSHEAFSSAAAAGELKEGAKERHMVGSVSKKREEGQSTFLHLAFFSVLSAAPSAEAPPNETSSTSTFPGGTAFSSSDIEAVDYVWNTTSLKKKSHALEGRQRTLCR